MRSDNAKSEISHKWIKHCRDYCIKTEYTEPTHPQQNPAERRVSHLNRMVRQCLKAFNAPIGLYDWCVKWVKDVHNVSASHKLNWKTPDEYYYGNTPDISKYRFHFYEPIWYYDPNTPKFKNNLKKGRWLGFAPTSGDELTYYIITEKDKGKNVILVRSVIKTRRINIGKVTEYVNNDPEYATFSLDQHVNESFNSSNIKELIQDSGEISSQSEKEKDIEDSREATINHNKEVTEETTEKENLPPEEDNNDEEFETVYDEFDSREKEIDNLEFNKILDHKFDNGILMFKVRYTGDVDETDVDLPFSILKKDQPMDTARYISNHVLDDKRNGRYNSWAKNRMKKHARTIRKLYRIHGINSKIRKNDDQYLKSVIKRMKNQNKTKFGIKIPRNVKEALLFDKFNKNTLWADAIAKEMEALRKLDVFEFLPPNCNFRKEDGWQYAPMHMISP